MLGFRLQQSFAAVVSDQEAPDLKQSSPPLHETCKYTTETETTLSFSLTSVFYALNESILRFKQQNKQA